MYNHGKNLFSGPIYPEGRSVGREPSMSKSTEMLIYVAAGVLTAVIIVGILLNLARKYKSKTSLRQTAEPDQNISSQLYDALAARANV